METAKILATAMAETGTSRTVTAGPWKMTAKENKSDDICLPFWPGDHLAADAAATDAAGSGIWIVGAGRFGMMALCKLQNRIGARYVVIDLNPLTCEDAHVVTEAIVCRDGVDFLSERLNRMGGPRWIIPAVPVHLAYEWLRRRLRGVKLIRPVPVPADVEGCFPNPMRGRNGELYLSNADFMCPANCSEPDRVCSYTGKARPCILFQELRKFQHDRFRSVVIRSRQLAPGVGGYTPRDLYSALDAIVSADGPVLMSTACKCHGVMHAFTVESNGRTKEASGDGICRAP